MSQLLQRIVFGVSEAARNWTIVKNRFLVPVKPKRPLSAYILFGNEKRSTLKGSAIEIVKQIGAEWKQLTPQQKQKYADQAKKLSEKYQLENQQYESKYIQPFKTINSANLIIKSLPEKPASLKDSAQKIKALFKNLTEQDRQKYMKEADKIRQERAKIQVDFEIPEPQFRTEKAYIDNALRQKNLPTFSQLEQKEQQKIKKEYVKYCESFDKALEAFAKKHKLTLENLKEIIKLNQRRLRREQCTQIAVNQLGGPEKPTKLRKRRTLAVSATRRPAANKRLVRKTATRTKVTKKAGSGTVTKKAASRSKPSASKTVTNKKTTTSRRAVSRK